VNPEIKVGFVFEGEFQMKKKKLCRLQETAGTIITSPLIT